MKREDLPAHLIELTQSQRIIVAVAGPPGSGKSTVAEALCQDVERLAGQDACAIVPMDGYHFDNAVLDEMEARDRKGAPHTFNVSGLAEDLRRIRNGGQGVVVPVFDRKLDLARANARLIRSKTQLILVEGNYLLFDQSPWMQLAELFDLTVWIDVDDKMLEKRLVERWLALGSEPSSARNWVANNDMPNVRLAKMKSRKADIVLNNASA